MDLGGGDPALGWLRQHARDLLSDLQVDGRLARAADEGHPAGYLAPRAADLAFLIHGAADLLDDGALDSAVATALYLLRQRAPDPPEELPARAWLLASVANATSNSSFSTRATCAAWRSSTDSASHSRSAAASSAAWRRATDASSCSARTCQDASASAARHTPAIRSTSSCERERETLVCVCVCVYVYLHVHM